MAGQPIRRARERERLGLPPKPKPAAKGAGSGTTRPPFPPGHSLHLTSGWSAPRVYQPLAAELVAGLLQTHPDLDRYPGAVARWAEWEARAMLLRRHLATIGDLNEAGEPRPGLTAWLRSCENSAERAGALLGLDPRSEAALARERATAGVLAVNLDAIAQAGREAIERREAAGLPGPPDLAGEAIARVAAEGRQIWQQANEQHLAITGQVPSGGDAAEQDDTDPDAEQDDAPEENN